MATRCGRCGPPPGCARSPPLHLPRRGLRGVGARHDGPAVPAEAERLAARDQRLPGQPRAHQCRVADRRARARQPRGPVEGNRDRLGHLHRRAHAHRGDALSGRVGRHGAAGDAAYRRQPGQAAHPALDRHAGGIPAAASAAHRAVPASVRMGAGIADLSLHADARRPHRDAAWAARGSGRSARC